MMRVALYIRVSTDEQRLHGLSIDAQTEALDEWAKQNKVKVVDHYVDAGISARKKAAKRPDLQRLLVDIRAGKIDLVVFTKLDRWFRNISEYYKVQEVLDDHHVGWKTIHEDYDTTSASGRLKINIMLSVAQDEADRTSERIKVVFESKLERREPITGNTPTGYRIEGKKLVKDEDLEPIVSDFFKHFMSCGSISTTQNYIQYKYQYHIDYQLASKMLHSKAYYGCYYGIEDMCPGYITKSEFDYIQSIRKRIVRKVKNNRVYLFSGMISCGECGNRMAGKCNNGRNVNSPFYNCPAHYLKKTCCNNTNLSEKKIESYLLDTIEQRLESYKIEVAHYQKSIRAKSNHAEIAALKAKLSKLKDLYLNDLITLDEYRADKDSFSKRIEALESQESAKPVDFSAIDAALVDGWRDVYVDLDKQLRRGFWMACVKDIRVYNDRHIDYDLNL